MAFNRPVYEISDPEEFEDGRRNGISQIAYTATPAIISKGVAFNSVQKELRFADELQLRVAAPVLIPMEIYRCDELGEYDIRFTAEKIKKLAVDFMKNRTENQFNLDHKQTLQAPSFLVECWIVDNPQTDQTKTKYGLTVPKGSFFVVSQFTDREYFLSEIIEKGRTGYSIEGFLGLELQKIKNQILSDMNNNTEQNSTEQKLDAVLKALTTLNERVLKLESIEDEAEKKDEETTSVDEKKAEEKPAEDEKPEDVKPIDEAAILAILQPKLEELYKEIAELKTAIESKGSEPEAEELSKETKLSAQSSLLSLIKHYNA